MYDEDDLSLLDVDETPESPLDQMAPLDDPSVVAARPDVEEMLQLMSAPDAPQRMLATRAFCELQEPRAIPHLIRLLTDSCPLVRVSAAYALGHNPSVTAVDSLIEQLDLDWNGYVRKGAVWALGNCRDRRSLAPLTNALRTDISAVRLWAASSLGQMAEVDTDSARAAIPPLVEALTHDALPAVRSNSAWSLGQLCQSIEKGMMYAQAVEALINALQDADLGVQEDAKSSLLKLGDTRGLQIIEALEMEGLL
ncbi:MAG: HEAT repeat domain-containing protein [Thermosynechococcaceae cyanobacterium]